MATTSPDNIRTPNPSDPYNLVTDLGVLANDTQTALTRRANLYVGTAAERTAFTTAPEGVHWQDTDGLKTYWVKRSGGWVELDTTPTSVTSGFLTAAAGWSISSATLIRVGKTRQFYISATRTGAPITVAATGDIANSTVATITRASDRPVMPTALTSGAAGRTASGYISQFSGAVDVVSTTPGGPIATSEALSFGGTWITP